MHPPIRFATTSDGVGIAYCSHGSGPPLAFVRGWLSHLEGLWLDPRFRAYVGAFAEQFTFIRYDSRGQGLSDRDVGDISFDGVVADLEAVMDDAGVDRGVLYGQAYGGPIAIAYAARHPERVERLVLDGTYAKGADLGTAETQRSIVEAVERLWPEAFSVLSAFTNPEEQHRSPWRRREWAERTTDAPTAASLYRLAFSVDVSSLLGRVEAPTLVLHRRRSRAVPFGLGRMLHAGLPNATFVAVDGSEHNPWEGNSESVLRAVGDFLGVTLRLVPQEDDPAWIPEAFGGPVTIMFTDIESSTALTHELGDERAVRELYRRHDDIVRRMLREHAGTEVSHTGDGILAVFVSVSRAVECAIAIQRELSAAGVGFAVRIGLNAGEPVRTGGVLSGVAVNTASRITGLGEGGQIVVAEVVRQLVEGKQFRFADLGPHELRGIPQPVRVYEVLWSPDPSPAGG